MWLMQVLIPTKAAKVFIYMIWTLKKGRITERCEVTIDNPSYITLSSNKKYLYAICDQGISSFAITEDGSLELMNVASIKRNERLSYFCN